MTNKQKQYEEKIKEILRKLKFVNVRKKVCRLQVLTDGYKRVGELEVVTKVHLYNPYIISLLAAWREKNTWWFPSQFPVTIAGTKKWSHEQLLNNPDRILFFVKNNHRKYIGHLGLYRFNFSKRVCEIDNVVRGVSDSPGLMTKALITLIRWSFSMFNLKALALKVFSDNERAIALYRRCGFREIRNIPLMKIVEGDTIRWEEIPESDTQKPERFFLQMKLERKNTP